MSDKKTTKREEETLDLSVSRPVLTIDYARYEAMLEGGGLSAAEKHEVLDALWFIITGFVDLGFQVNPLDAAANAKAPMRPVATKRDCFNQRAGRTARRRPPPSHEISAGEGARRRA